MQPPTDAAGSASGDDDRWPPSGCFCGRRGGGVTKAGNGTESGAVLWPNEAGKPGVRGGPIITNGRQNEVHARCMIHNTVRMGGILVDMRNMHSTVIITHTGCWRSGGA